MTRFDFSPLVVVGERVNSNSKTAATLVMSGAGKFVTDRWSDPRTREGWQEGNRPLQNKTKEN